MTFPTSRKKISGRVWRMPPTVRSVSLFWQQEIALRSEFVATSRRAAYGSHPDSNHVYPLGLDRVPDHEVREHARREGLLLVT